MGNEEKKSNEEKQGFNIKNLSKKSWIFMGGIVVVLIIIIIALLSSTTNKIGNSIGNIRNYGYVASENDWIYYLSPNKDGKQVGIYRVKANGSKKKELSMGDMDILSINAYDGYLYFIGISKDAYDEETGELKNENDEVDNKIYRMRSDGKSEMEIINDNEFHNDCYEIYVYRNQVYYIGTDQNIWIMDLNGANKRVFVENGTGYLGINEKYIIYNSEQFLTPTKETEEQKNEQAVENTVNVETAENPVDNATTDVDTPNTTEANDDAFETKYETTYVTYIMDIDGNNARPIIKDKRIYSINIRGNYIYYTNEDKQICRTKIDSNEEEILLDTTAYNLNMYGNYLYFFNYEDPSSEESKVCIYRTRIDRKATEAEKIKELDSYSAFLSIVNGQIVYMDAQNQEAAYINLLNINNRKEIKLYELSYDKLNEDAGYSSEDEITDDNSLEEVPEELEETTLNGTEEAVETPNAEETPEQSTNVVENITQ